MKFFVTVFCLLLAIAGNADNKIIYSLQCQDGGAVETGGTLLQHNSDNVSRLNVQSCGNYVICVVGKKECIDLENGSSDACYFELTLADGDTFHAGDVITITGMRNLNRDCKANLYFLYSNGAVDIDNNVWNNLGLLQEMTFGGGTEAKSGSRGGSTEPLAEFSMFPSTYSFVVPENADGALSLKITRNDSDGILYITKIAIGRDVPSGIVTPATSTAAGVEYNLSGQPASMNTKGVILTKGRKYVRN